MQYILYSLLILKMNLNKTKIILKNCHKSKKKMISIIFVLIRKTKLLCKIWADQ